MTAATLNGFDPAKVTRFVGEVEKIMEQMESEKGSYMARMKGFRDEIKDVYADAKDADLPVKELKAVIKTRELERRAEKQRDALTDDQADNYDLLRHALGDLADTPLGRAALGDDDDQGDEPGDMDVPEVITMDDVNETAGAGNVVRF